MKYQISVFDRDGWPEFSWGLEATTPIEAIKQSFTSARYVFEKEYVVTDEEGNKSKFTVDSMSNNNEIRD